MQVLKDGQTSPEALTLHFIPGPSTRLQTTCLYLHRLHDGKPGPWRFVLVPPGVADYTRGPYLIVKRGMSVAGHPELRSNVLHQRFGIVNEIRIERVTFIQFLVDCLQCGRKMRDDYVHLAGLRRYVLCDSPELLRVLERVPIPGQREIRNHRGIANMVHGVAPEIRTPLRAVEAQALDLGRVVVEIMKSLVGVREGAPEGVHVLLGGVVVLVVARYKNDRRDAELAADERQTEISLAVHDIPGQNEQVPGPVRRELVRRRWQVPAPQLKMQVRCDLDFHAVPPKLSSCHYRVSWVSKGQTSPKCIFHYRRIVRPMALRLRPAADYEMRRLTSQTRNTKILN